MVQLDYNSTTLRRKYIGKSFPILLFFAFLHSLTGFSQTTYYSRGNGNWNSTSTWSTSPGGVSCNCIPSSGNVIISSGHTVTIPNNYSATILGDVIIKPSATLDLKQILNIGSAANCGYGLHIETDGKLIESGPGNGEKVKICDKIILSANQGSGVYQIPSGGIIGPVVYSEAGQEQVLPVVLKSFDLEELPQGIKLTWETTMELDNAGFEIQRSTDGFLTYESVGFVNGFGTSSKERDYSYLDGDGKGSLYYRLKQMDFDGQYVYSVIQYVHGAKFAEQAIYPNPTAGGVTLNLPEFRSGDSVYYSIIGADGQVKVARKSCAGNSIDTDLSGEISNLNRGTYTILLGSIHIRRSVKLIKI